MVTWSEAERAKIVAEYDRSGRATCPADREPLHVDKSTSGSPRSVVVRFNCPKCYRAFIHTT